MAWRDPKLLIRDIEHVQNHVWGPIFVLNDFLQAGPEYTREFVCGRRARLKNPIGFEFFGPPPGATTLPMLDENLKSWSVEISAESHDDDVRKAFGKGHYTMRELEGHHRRRAVASQLRTLRFVLHDGHPQADGEKRARNRQYVQHLYERVNYDPRLVVLTSPWRRFWT